MCLCNNGFALNVLSDMTYTGFIVNKCLKKYIKTKNHCEILVQDLGFIQVQDLYTEYVHDDLY